MSESSDLARVLAALDDPRMDRDAIMADAARLLREMAADFARSADVAAEYVDWASPSGELERCRREWLDAVRERWRLPE